LYYKIYIDSKNQAKITFANITSSNTNPFQFSNTSSNQKKQRTGGSQMKKKPRAKPLYNKNAEALIAKIGNAQQKITPQNNKQNFSGLDKTILDRVTTKKIQIMQKMLIFCKTANKSQHQKSQDSLLVLKTKML
jgi:hypothetical protein